MCPPTIVAALLWLVLIDMLVGLSPVLLPDLPWPFDLVVGSLGALLFGAGIALNVRASKVFANLGTPMRPGTRASALAAEGPFRRSRNPMYLGLVSVLLGITLWVGTAVSFAATSILALLFSRYFVPNEEADLSASFGPEWIAYSQRVPRWLGFGNCEQRTES